MLLVVTIRSPLESKYGREGFERIQAALAQYGDALAAPPLLLFLDDADSMSQIGLGTAKGLNGGALLLHIREIRGAISAVDALFIVGGDSVFPYWQFQNPVRDRGVDPDEVVYTDNPYGSDGDSLFDYLAPKLPVGRLADAANGTTGDFLKLIAAASGNHRQRATRNGSAAVYNEQWKDQVDKVAQELTSPLDEYSTPTYRVTSGNRSDLDRRLLYFNLHGFLNDSEWKGFNPISGQFFSALTPDSFDRTYVSGSVVFAENCYGGWTVGKNSSNSCAMRLLDQGVAGMVGATGLAYGSHISPGMLLENADQLARSFFNNNVRGESIGQSLVDARKEFLHSNQNPDVFLQKTLLQFTLLGDPSLA